MKRIHTRILRDEELRPQLETGDVIFFLGRRVKLEEIERQIERLGFGELYIASETQGPKCRPSKNPSHAVRQRQTC